MGRRGGGAHRVDMHVEGCVLAAGPPRGHGEVNGARAGGEERDGLGPLRRWSGPPVADEGQGVQEGGHNSADALQTSSLVVAECPPQRGGEGVSPSTQTRSAPLPLPVRASPMRR